jgi:hypothetical protein
MPISFTKTTHPIDFSKLSGHEFERLVFATLLRMRGWHSLNWHGQSGGDGGRDILGICENPLGQKEAVVVACANWQAFTVAKATRDIDSFVKTLGKAPNQVIVVAGSSVSADAKDKIAAYAISKGILEAHTWSGAEFEEFLRFHAPSVLDRFYHGVELPDSENSLRDFVQKLDPTTATEAAEMLARLFRRPAFETPIYAESSLPAFRQAIADTICALNTGIWRDREGTIISRVPSIEAFEDDGVVKGLRACASSLNKLRIAFDQGLRDQGIRPCSCAQPECSIFAIDEKYLHMLEIERSTAMRHAEDALATLRATRN